jgi:predicted ester cyclase
MEQTEKNKAFILDYFNSMSNATKKSAIARNFIDDEELIEHINMFESAFPKYELIADEIISEGNLVVVKARCKGTHQGDLNGIAPTYKKVDFPFAIRYEIKNNRIISHWMIADQANLLQQLGVMPEPKAIHQ